MTHIVYKKGKWEVEVDTRMIVKVWICYGGDAYVKSSSGKLHESIARMIIPKKVPPIPKETLDVFNFWCAMVEE